MIGILLHIVSAVVIVGILHREQLLKSHRTIMFLLLVLTFNIMYVFSQFLMWIINSVVRFL